MLPPEGRRARLPLLAIGATAVAVRLFIGPYIADDAYITFRYSENVASGHGLVYNRGERVQGTTTPLFAIVLAGPAALGLDPAWTSFALNTAADLVTIGCGAVLLLRAGWPVAALLYGVALAFWPAFIIYSVSGLETSTYVALLTVACLLADSGRGAATGVAVGLAALCRPDGALLGPLVVVFLWRRRGAGAAIRAGAAGTLTVLPWALFALVYYHTLVPASVVAKAHSRLTAGESLAAFLARFWSGAYIAITPLAAAGALALVRQPRSIFLLLALWWLAYASIFIVSGAFGLYPWYFVPLIPFYVACAGVSIEAALRFVVPRAHLEQVAAIVVVALALVLGARLPSLRATLDRWFQTREYLYREVAERVLTRRDCVVGATEIGALGYYYRGPVLDMVGLVSPEVTRRPLIDIIEAVRPCWIVSYDSHLDPAVSSSGAFARAYQITFRRRVGPKRELLVFRRR